MPDQSHGLGEWIVALSETEAQLCKTRIFLGVLKKVGIQPEPSDHLLNDMFEGIEKLEASLREKIGQSRQRNDGDFTEGLPRTFVSKFDRYRREKIELFDSINEFLEVNHHPLLKESPDLALDRMELAAKKLPVATKPLPDHLEKQVGAIYSKHYQDLAKKLTTDLSHTLQTSLEVMQKAGVNASTKPYTDRLRVLAKYFKQGLCVSEDEASIKIAEELQGTILESGGLNSKKMERYPGCVTTLVEAIQKFEKVHEAQISQIIATGVSAPPRFTQRSDNQKDGPQNII